MSDRMRSALFNTLGDIEGLTVLDAFAGSGAIAIESVSRGAAQAVAVERDISAYRTLEENVEGLGATDKIQTIRANVSSWADTTSSDQKYDVIICDPPYDDVQLSALKKLSERLAPNGTYVLSLASDAEAVDLPKLEKIKMQKHAGGSLHYYK